MQGFGLRSGNIHKKRKKRKVGSHELFNSYHGEQHESIHTVIEKYFICNCGTASLQYMRSRIMT